MNKQNLFIFLALLLLLFPPAWGGYVSQYILIGLFILTCAICYGIKFNYYLTVLSLLFFLSVSFFTNLATSNDIYNLRYFIRILPFCLFYINWDACHLTKNTDVFFIFVARLLACLVFIDMSLYILSCLSLPTYNYIEIHFLLVKDGGVFDSIMRHHSYWRYVGIWGQPNYSATLYVITALLNIYSFRATRSFSRIFSATAVLVPIFLMSYASSRTAIIALALAIILLCIMRFRSQPTSFLKMAAIIIASVAVISALLYAFGFDFSALFYRFSSGLDIFKKTFLGNRLYYWHYWLSFFSPKMLFFGDTNILKESIYKSVDNGYIFYFILFGLPALLSYISIYMAALFKLYVSPSKKMLFEIFLCIVFACFISAITSTVFSNPKMAFILLLTCSVIFDNYKKEREHK